jgi:thiamine-phosphate pyrophosphorylase
MRRDPAICLVTDRTRLPQASDAEVVRLVEAAAAAGVTLIQVREREIDDRRLLGLTRTLLAGIEGTGAALVVNDRTDVALAAGAQGVHLRERSVGADRVRAIAHPGFLVGRSVHDRTAASGAAATPVDYLIMGTIFATRSKDAAVRPAGLDELGAVCRAVHLPVLAIGGITAERAEEVAAAGAAGIAAIGLFADLFGAHDGPALEPALREAVIAIRRAFIRGRDGSRLPISAD